jgi:arginyl-tRNA synthetase
MQFHHTIQAAADSFRPNLIADYLYQLAQKFSSFYAEAPILPESNPETRHSRIRLALLCAETIKYGLNLLGIETLPRM